MTLTFRRASEISGLRRAFLHERQLILARLPEAVVVHTGASSLPALLTRGDLDIHVRVPSRLFGAAAASLEEAWQPHRPEMWTDEFAAFTALRNDLPVGISLTAMGGEHDRRFSAGWRRLASEPRLVREYNALKLRHAGGDAVAYEAEKSEFFTRIAGP